MKSISLRQAVNHFIRQLCHCGLKLVSHDPEDSDSLIRMLMGRGIHVRILAGNGRPAIVEACDRQGFDCWENSVNFYVNGIPSDAAEFLRKVTQLRRSGVWDFHNRMEPVAVPVIRYSIGDDVIVEKLQYRAESLVLDAISANLLPIDIADDLREVYCRVATAEEGKRTWIFKAVPRPTINANTPHLGNGPNALVVEQEFKHPPL